MALKFLPNTAITSMVMGNTIYSYAQTEEGDIYEFSGYMKSPGTAQSAYAYDKRKSGYAVPRADSGQLVPNAPKMFTPVAAAPYTVRINDAKTIRYIFYVDDRNILRDSINDGREWKEGLLGSAGVYCAQYSRLAAITIAGNVYNDICLYYQATTDDAAIKMVHYNPEYNYWQHGTPNLLDPPLLGTSITAVHPRSGILVGTTEGTADARQPVYYLQLDDLRLGHAQGVSDPQVMSGLELDGKALVFSPQTSLTAVDDGVKLYIVYKSDGAKIKMIEIINGRPNPPEKFQDIDTTPMSAIAGCLSPDRSSTKIVLFYQSLNRSTMQVNLWGTTLFKAQAVATEWTASTPVKLGV